MSHFLGPALDETLDANVKALPALAEYERMLAGKTQDAELASKLEDVAAAGEAAQLGDRSRLRLEDTVLHHCAG